MVSILHISDLHRSPDDPISNDVLISSLVADRDHYVAEDPPVPAPEAIIVSGDLIQGASLDIPIPKLKSSGSTKRLSLFWRNSPTVSSPRGR